MKIDHFQDEYECIFFHVPKTGGLTVRKILYKGDNLRGGHYTPAELRELMPDKYDSYFKFGLVRNPYDKLVSAYEYKRTETGNHHESKQTAKFMRENFEDFEDYVFNYDFENPPHDVARKQHEFLCLDGELQTDYLGRFENYRESLKEAFDLIGFEFDFDFLPHVNKTRSRDRKRNYYNDKIAEKVYGIYQRDFQMFDYDKNSYQ